MTQLLALLAKHQALISALPGVVEAIIALIHAVMAAHGKTEPEKQAAVDQLATDLKALAASYRDNPPRLPSV